MGSSLMSQEWFLNFTSNLNLILQKEKNKRIVILPITWLQRYSTTQTNVKNWDLIHSILPLCKNSYFLGFQVSIIILITTPSRNYCQVSGLSKVAGCRRNLPPTWSVSASYSAWHFFMDGIFLKISLDWPLTLTTQLSISKILTTLSIQINGNLDLLGSYFAEQLYSQEFQHAVIHWYYPLLIKNTGPSHLTDS